MLQSKNQMVDVWMPLPFQRAFVCYTVFNVNYQVACGLCGIEHASSKWQEPFDVTVWMDAAICPRIGVRRAGKKEVHAFPWELRQKLLSIA
jgi:hypothetical protein